MQRDQAILLDLIHAARLALDFIDGMNWEQFVADVKTQSAVIHQIIILGEAARRTTVEFRVAHPELPWPQMMGMRNRLIHEYDKIKLDLLWSTLEHDLPGLIGSIEALIPKGK